MSDSVNTNTLAFYRGKDRPCGVAVSPGGVTAGPAPENSFRQWESLLGSRETTRTRHRCVGGRHNHHRPASPRSGSDQFTFRCTDSVVGSFTRHRGLEQELGAEVFHRDQLVGGDDAARPLAGRVLALPGDFLVQPRSLSFRGLITPGTPASGFRFTPRHPPLVGDQFLCRCFRIFGALKVELGLGRGGDAGHTPVDTDRPRHLGQRLVEDAYDEAGVPVPESVPIHPIAGWLRRQLPRPHDRDQPTPRQPQPTIFEAEPVAGVFQARPRFLRVLEGASALARERAQRLGLRGHRAGGQPRQRGPRGSQILARQVSPTVFARCHALVPNPAGPMPLAHQRTLGLRSRAQPIIVPQHRGCRHKTNVSGGSDISRTRHMHRATANGRPYLPIAKARGISGGSR